MPFLPEPVAVEARAPDGVRIRAWDYGGTGPLLFFCHCMGTCGRIFEPAIRKLRGAWRVVAVDARGHGDSDKPEAREAYTWLLGGGDLLAVLDALGEREAMAAGHSGGATQIVTAALQRPGAFSRVALFDAIVSPPDYFAGPNRLAESARRRRDHFDSFEEALDRFRWRAPLSLWHEEVLRAYVAHGLEADAGGGVRLKCPGAIEAYYYEQGDRGNWFARLSELDCATLLVTAERSDIRPLALMQREALPNAVFAEMPFRGHFFPLEAPGAMAALVDRWFSGAY